MHGHCWNWVTEGNLVDSVEEQLASIVGACRDDAGLAKIFYHPMTPVEAKRNVVLQLFKPIIADFVGKFLLLLIDKRRESLLPAIYAEYQVLPTRSAISAKGSNDRFAATSSKTIVHWRELGALTGSKIELVNTVDREDHWRRGAADLAIDGSMAVFSAIWIS